MSHQTSHDSAPEAAPGRAGWATMAEMEQALRAALQPTALSIRDDSHLHAGHEGARHGGHYTVSICSERFAGLSRVERHRLVYDALSSLMPRGIHALAIQASTPGGA